MSIWEYALAVRYGELLRLADQRPLTRREFTILEYLHPLIERLEAEEMTKG